MRSTMKKAVALLVSMSLMTGVLTGCTITIGGKSDTESTTTETDKKSSNIDDFDDFDDFDSFADTDKAKTDKSDKPNKIEAEKSDSTEAGNKKIDDDIAGLFDDFDSSKSDEELPPEMVSEIEKSLEEGDALLAETDETLDEFDKMMESIRENGFAEDSSDSYFDTDSYVPYSDVPILPDTMSDKEKYMEVFKTFYANLGQFYTQMTEPQTLAELTETLSYVPIEELETVPKWFWVSKDFDDFVAFDRYVYSTILHLTRETGLKSALEIPNEQAQSILESSYPYVGILVVTDAEFEYAKQNKESFSNTYLTTCTDWDGTTPWILFVTSGKGTDTQDCLMLYTDEGLFPECITAEYQEHLLGIVREEFLKNAGALSGTGEVYTCLEVPMTIAMTIAFSNYIYYTEKLGVPSGIGVTFGF